MKKVFLFLALAFGALAAQSCEDAKVSIEYDVTIAGDADGNVNVSFPDGTLVLNGDADLNFHYGNAAQGFKNEAGVLALSDALSHPDKEVAAFAKSVDEEFSAAAASGTYYVSVKGYAKETLTGVTISIDKEFTNRKK